MSPSRRKATTSFGMVRRWRRAAGTAALALLVPLVLLGCRASETTEPEPGPLSLAVDIVPLILPADTSETATVWVTVLEAGDPAADSTRVDLVATLGSVPETVYTRDGLATASFHPGTEAGAAAVIAQCRGVRDTMMITLY